MYYNRWKFKHPGRVGDAPLVGSGLYCDGAVGAAVATGDGEEVLYVTVRNECYALPWVFRFTRIHRLVWICFTHVFNLCFCFLQIMRTCLSFLVVEYMRQGISVGEACKKGIERLLQLQPLHTFSTGVGCVSSVGGSSGGSGGSIDRTAPSLETMHSTLVVGVLAMDKDGNVSAVCAHITIIHLLLGNNALYI